MSARLCSLLAALLAATGLASGCKPDHAADPASIRCPGGGAARRVAIILPARLAKPDWEQIVREIDNGVVASRATNVAVTVIDSDGNTLADCGVPSNPQLATDVGARRDLAQKPLRTAMIGKYAIGDGQPADIYALADVLARQSGPSPVNIVVVGALRRVNPADPSTAMQGGLYPSDWFLTDADSLISTRGREKALFNLSVRVVAPASETWDEPPGAGAAYERRVQHFVRHWLELQAAKFDGYYTTLQAAVASAIDNQSGGVVESVEPVDASAKREMIDVDPPEPHAELAACTPARAAADRSRPLPPVMEGRWLLGLSGSAADDVDLYAAVGRMQPISYLNPNVTGAGTFQKNADLAGGDVARGFESIELPYAALRDLRLAVNLYRRDAAKAQAGTPPPELRVVFGGLCFIERLSFGPDVAGDLGAGVDDPRRYRLPAWREIDLSRVVPRK
jgi:hypothetical protein